MIYNKIFYHTVPFATDPLASIADARAFCVYRSDIDPEQRYMEILLFRARGAAVNQVAFQLDLHPTLIFPEETDDQRVIFCYRGGKCQMRQFADWLLDHRFSEVAIDPVALAISRQIVWDEDE